MESNLLLNKKWVGSLNFFILQWFFIRLYYTNEVVPQYGILKFVIPLTGWTFLPCKHFKYL